MIEECVDIERRLAMCECIGGIGRPAMAAQVRDNDAEFLGVLAAQVAPVLPGAAEAVQQHERRSASRDLVIHVDSVNGGGVALGLLRERTNSTKEDGSDFHLCVSEMMLYFRRTSRVLTIRWRF